MKNILKFTARGAALIFVLPVLISYYLRAVSLGRNRALQGSSQLLALIPGLPGQYLRRAFYSRVLAECHHTAVIEFGVLFSQCGARIGENAYIGPYCLIGLAHIEKDALLAPSVHIPSGRLIHDISDPDIPIREQGGTPCTVRIGAGSWIGSGAVVMADVGRHTVVGAGSVVTRPLPDYVIAGGIPARVIRARKRESSDRELPVPE